MKTQRFTWWGTLKNGALKLGVRPPVELDMVLDALFFRLRNAGPWRDLPDGFGPWRTICGWYQRPARQGTWERLLRRLAVRSKSSIRLVDGTHAVAHQCTATPAGEAQKQAMGRTRGGRNTKIMALTDGHGLPVKLLLIEGQAYEGRYVVPWLEAPEVLMLVGDKGFDSDPLRQQLEQLGASHCIPSRSNRHKKRRLNKKLYRQRYKVENYFCRLKRWASASTRRENMPFTSSRSSSLLCTSTGFATAVEDFQTRPRQLALPQPLRRLVNLCHL